MRIYRLNDVEQQCGKVADNLHRDALFGFIQMQLSSSVQIRRTCTFVLTCLPVDAGSSISSASHQHLRCNQVHRTASAMTESTNERTMAYCRFPPEEQQLLRGR